MKKQELVLGALCLVLSAARADVPRVIYDTDIGSSMCDLSALDMAVQLDELGYMKLIGVVLDRPDYSDPAKEGRFLEFTDRTLAGLGRTDIPIARSMPLKDADGNPREAGVYIPYWSIVDSNNVAAGGAALPAVDTARYADLPDAVTLYRRLLYDSDGPTVSICAVGFFNNLIALMKSEANENGDGIRKSGMELIREKVRALRVMAGCFEGDGVAQGDHGEPNVHGDIRSARRIFDEWPGKIVCSPWEAGLKFEYKPDWMRLDFPCGCCNEVLHAFDKYWHEPAPTDEFPNRLWDALTVIGVVHEDALPLSPCGAIAVEDETGITRFTQRMGERCRYQYLESEADARTLMETMRVILSDGRSSETWSVGENIVAYTNGEGVLTFIGTGEMRDFTSAADVPWDPAKVTRVEVDDGVKVIGANAFAALEEFVPVNGLPISFQKEVASAMGPRDQALPEGTVPVSMTELKAAGAETLTITDGTAYLGVSVYTSDTLADPNWSVAFIRKPRA